MAPQTHTRYRVQQLIRMGEWLERNGTAMSAMFFTINQLHDVLFDADAHEDDFADTVQHVSIQMAHQLSGLGPIMSELARMEDHPAFAAELGKDVTIRQPFADAKHRDLVVIEAPKFKPAPVEAQEESIDS